MRRVQVTQWPLWELVLPDATIVVRDVWPDGNSYVRVHLVDNTEHVIWDNRTATDVYYHIYRQLFVGPRELSGPSVRYDWSL